MSERKVLNKYYPPDFDPTKLPKLKQSRNRQFVIRIMAPFSMSIVMRAVHDGYIMRAVHGQRLTDGIFKAIRRPALNSLPTFEQFKFVTLHSQTPFRESQEEISLFENDQGKSGNVRETVENENYLGLRIYRFYIRCTKCISEITFKTDPENTDYTMEHGATRNFEAFKKLQQQVAKANKDKEDEEENNPMKALENRTKDSKREMESIEQLEELKDLNTRTAKIDHEKLIMDHMKEAALLKSKQEEDDEILVRSIFGGSATDGYVNRIIDSDSSDDDSIKMKFPLGVKRSIEKSNEDQNPSTSKDIVGPSLKASKKIKLKIPDESAALVRLKKPLNKNSDKKILELSSTEISVKKQETVKVDGTQPPTQAAEPTIMTSLPSPRSTFKINLKKNNDNSKVKIKGTSLNILGAYGSDSLSDDTD